MTSYCKAKQEKSSQSGVTIIALVITIAVLLILAGASLNSIVGDSGVIDSTREGINKVIKNEDSIQSNLNDLMDQTDEQLSTETWQSTPPSLKDH